MSNLIEDRLAAALEARAELVAQDDLTPIKIPEPPRRRGRGTVILLVAAASAAVIATPFILRAGDDDSSPGPTHTPSVAVTEPTTEPSPTQPTQTETNPDLRDVTVAGRQRADVDGDGRPDQVKLVTGTLPNGGMGGTIEVSLASGETGSAAAPPNYYLDLLPAFDINRDGRQQVLVSASGGDEAARIVFNWYDGGLVRAEIVGKAPLALGLDGQGRYADYYTDDRGLFSWLRQDAIDSAGGPIFNVKVWSWLVEGDRLVSSPAGHGCVDVTTEDIPQPC